MLEPIEELKKELAHYKKIFGIAEYDPATSGYTVLIEQLRQRNDFLKEFKIKDKIGSIAKDDPVYVRAMELIDGLPKMISSVNNLRFELKIEYSIEDGKIKQLPISPQNIGKVN